jgi:hypothetical protein
MILQTRGPNLLVIRQTDHAALAGLFATHWGNGDFAPPDPRSALVTAGTHHDDGWLLWESAPRVDPATRRPCQFTDLPVAEHLGFYRAGIDRVLAEDPYAGLLVSMHLAGLYQRRFGTDRTMPDRALAPGEAEVLRDILAQLKAQQQELREQLPGRGVPAQFLEEAHLWAGYKLLQVFDRLSLYFCMAPPRPATLGPAPRGYTGAETELTLEPRGPGVVAISPYPFDADPLPVSVQAAVVPDRAYDSDADFRSTFAVAPVTTLAFELRAG